VQSGVSASMNIKSKPPAVHPKPPTRAPIWPWLWIALTAVATVGWLIAIGWATVALAKWILD
jgi:hypothetical protein